MLTVRNTEAIRQIEAAIGYTFHDKRLLVQVLTRKTYLKIDPEAPDNEVLEFYGDTLMNYHVTNYFMAKYAHMLEDGLFFMRTVEQFTDLRSHYVCNRYLTERVKALGLARYLRAQNRDAELRRDSEKAYADIFESLVGAIYLDSYQNDALIRAFILRQLGIDPKRAPADIESFDYDTLLDPPEDAFYDEPDDPLLPAEPAAEEAPVPQEVETSVQEVAVIEETPAQEAVEDTEAPIVVVETPTAEIPVIEETPPPVAEVHAEPVGTVAFAPTANREKLARLCEQLGFDQPTYGETPPNAPNARPVAACTMKYKDAKGKQVKISLNDSGKTLAEATEKAAAKMLAKMEKYAASISAGSPAKPAVKAEKPAKFKAEKHSAAVTPAPAPVEVIPEEETPVLEAPADTFATSIEETPVVKATAIDVPVERTNEEIAPATASLTFDMAAEEMHSIEEIPSVTVAEDLVELVTAENTPVETVFETIPIEIPIEVSTATEAPEEIPTEVPAAEAPVEVVPTVEDKPAKKTSTKKKTASNKKTALVEEQAYEGVAEEINAELIPEETNPAKKAPAKKKTSAKKKVDTSNKAKPTEETPVEEKAAEVKPPRAPRKPRTKKEETPAADKPDEE